MVKDFTTTNWSVCVGEGMGKRIHLELSLKA